jgi:hypothetical protein
MLNQELTVPTYAGIQLFVKETLDDVTEIIYLLPKVAPSVFYQIVERSFERGMRLYGK